MSPHPDSPISPLSDSKVAALKVMAEISKSTSEEARDNEYEEPLPSMPSMALPGDNQPEKELPAAEPRVLKIPSQPSPPVQPPNTVPEPRMETPPKIEPHITYAAATRNRNATWRRKMKLATPTSKKTSAEFSKLVTYTVPTPKSRHQPAKKIPYPTVRVSQQRSSAPHISRQLKSNTAWENSIQTVSFNRIETNALLQVFANAGFGPLIDYTRSEERRVVNKGVPY